MHEYQDWNRNNAPVDDPRRSCDHPGCGQKREGHNDLLPLVREVPATRRQPAEWHECDVVAAIMSVGAVSLTVLWMLGLLPS